MTDWTDGWRAAMDWLAEHKGAEGIALAGEMATRLPDRRAKAGGGAFIVDDISGFDIAMLNDQESSGITAEELRRLDNLMDAVVYDWAVGAKTSPVKEIARRRCVSDRTAEGRIARARAMGFLTPAEGRRASGGLSEKGWDLVRRLEKLNAIQRGDS